MGSLLDSIKDSISPDLIRTLVSTTGESQDGIKKGLEAGAATMLGTIAAKSNDMGFMNQIVSMVTSYGKQTLGAAAGAGVSATTAAGETGSNLLNLLFGSNKASIEGKVAQGAGLSSAAGSAILSAAAPLVLSTLTSKLSGGAAGLSSALAAELPSLRAFIPAGIAGIHLPNLAGSASAARDAVGQKTGGGWLWPVLLIGALLIAALVWFFNRTPELAKPVENAAVATTAAAGNAATTATTAISDATKAAWAKLGELFKVKLPDGVELNIPKLGVESKLIDWIQSSNPVDKTTWFNFDRLLFATGSAELEPASQEQLANVAAILKAFPKVKVRLGGYTDNQGDADSNLKLSDARAKNVMAELVKLGIDPSRMSAQGYGEDHPVGDNMTEEGRQLNRRISLRVTEK